jgi:N6-L-threonylcarbamoyladenine synthase
LYHLRDEIKLNENYIEENRANLCASLQKTIIDVLIGKLVRASKETGIKEITVAGGVSANSGLRNELIRKAEQHCWNMFIPEFRYTTDNAAMIAITGHYKYLKGEFANHDMVPFARMVIK